MEVRSDGLTEVDLRLLLDAVDEAALVVDPETSRIIYANEGASRQTGYTRDQLLGMRPFDVASGVTEAEFHELNEPLLAGETSKVTFETTVQRLDGTKIAVEVLVQLAHLEGRRLLFALARDISERLADQDALAEANERLALAEERERIARDLHDNVTQRLYAIGLSLQAAALHLPPEHADRLESLVDALDDAIREIRTSIFALHPPRLGTSGLRRAVNERVKEATRLLGFPPKLRLEGPLDAVADPDVAAECLATLQEALSNVVRHSRATNVEVELVAESGALRLVVTDDGVGLPADAGERGGSGLHNVVERAARLGGYAEYHRGPGGVGTVLVWSVPLRRP